MGSIGRAIAWEIVTRQRLIVRALFAFVGLGSLLAWTSRWMSVPEKLAESIGYAVLTVAVFITFGCFRFTEGRRRGGFGSFPERLFHLPVRTARLVGLPMGLGLISVIAVYLGVATLVLAPLDRSPPLLWPCTYLVVGLAWFQAVIWSFPNHRYTKLLLLTLLAALIACAWMFFLPHVIEGTLQDWGYTGSVAGFQQLLLIGLALSVPVAYGLSVARVGGQRHGGGGRRFRGSPWHDKAGVTWRRWAEGPSPAAFRSAREALFWHEWRRTGLLLPVAVGGVLALTALPVLLSGELGPSGTRTLLVWILLAPLILGAVLGTGFGKPDFWQDDLGLPQFHAVLPFTSGAWILAKLEVAFVSVVVTWITVVMGGFVCLARAGDFLELQSLGQAIRHADPVFRGWGLGILGLATAIVLTWRLLVLYLWPGMSGNRRLHRLAGALTGAVLVGGLVWMISRDGSSSPGPFLHEWWPWVECAPLVMFGLVTTKALGGALAWHHLLARGLLLRGSIGVCFAAWILLTLPAALLPWIVFPHTPWLRDLLVGSAFLLVPLATPALAIIALARHRHAG